ncbi:glycoside hydrolase [Ceratobasidium sp. AG-I]|nr:glycoside hydrolase [Ceratobasidium sp. AG-I]
MFSFKVAPIFALISALTAVEGQSGTGVTTRYWDCCKESCGWSGKASVTGPVKSCDKNNNPLSDFNAKSSCDGGSAYACASHSPFAVDSSLAYGFAAARLQGGSESTWCCQCYQLTFTSGPVAGQKMIVQTTNTGGDLGNNHFDIMIPGGGVGLFGQGCASQYGAPSTGWGSQYGGISSRSQCSQLPSALQAGCYWRFDWFKNADNPSVSFTQVTCPSQLTSISGCTRK